MSVKPYLLLGLCFLFSGCGTLRIKIDYGSARTPGHTETLPHFEETPGAVSIWTPTPSVTPSPAPTSIVGESATPSSTESHSGVIAVAAGTAHTCELTGAGGVKCWGLNDKGQLGYGGFADRSVPVAVVGLRRGVAAIAAGGRHTCALMAGGGVKCWGENQSGQLGDGTHADSAVPVDVAGLSDGAAVIAAGGGHTCVLTYRGAAWCWGWNEAGQLGDGTNIDRSHPVPVDAAGTSFYAIAAGYKHTCGLTTSAGMKCWGENGAGQLGDGTTSDHSVPTDVQGLRTTVLTLSLGEGHTCALMHDRSILCWGDNAYGQLGNDSTGVSAFPVQVVFLAAGTVGVSAGFVHTCAMTESGVQCWGSNLFGQLGNGTEENALRPVTVVGFGLTAAGIAAGGNHTCALTAGGGVRCWGKNSSGQLGDGTTVDRRTPVDVSGLGFVAIVGCDGRRDVLL